MRFPSWGCTQFAKVIVLRTSVRISSDGEPAQV